MKILISGAGRSGTSLLMKMFIELGAKNLCKDKDYIDDYISAGLELSIKECLEFLRNEYSGVAKTPWLYEISHSDEFNRDNVDLVIIPIRDPNISTLSRLANEMMNISYEQDVPLLEHSFGRTPAGYHYWLDEQEQMRCLSSSLIMLLHQCAKKRINTSFVPFPEIGEAETSSFWANEIQEYTKVLGINAAQISEWLATNFSIGKTYEQALPEHQKTFSTYVKFIKDSKGLGQLSKTEAFMVAHGKYVKKQQDKVSYYKQIAENSQEMAEQARADAEQARADAEQARADAEQARADAEQARADAEQARIEIKNRCRLLYILKKIKQTVK